MFIIKIDPLIGRKCLGKNDIIKQKRAYTITLFFCLSALLFSFSETNSSII